MGRVPVFHQLTPAPGETTSICVVRETARRVGTPQRLLLYSLNLEIMSDEPDWKRCPTCDGNGTVITDEHGVQNCPTCGGDGRVEKEFHEKLSKEERQAMGGAGGALFGAAVGGPVGAVVGGVLGAALAGADDEDDEENEVEHI